MSRLSQNIRLIRVRAGISQNQLAEVLCLSRNQINNYENDISQPSIEVLYKFCQFFKISMDVVVGMDLNGRLLEELRHK